MAAGVCNWSQLPNELLTLVAENVESIEDFTRFGAVCHSWRISTLDKRHFDSFLKPSLPWLMLSANEDENDRKFFVPWENKTRRINLPEVRGRRCWGSAFGWLVTFGLDKKFHLFNIISRARIELPSLSTFVDSKFANRTPPTHLMDCVSKAFVVSPSPQNLVDDYLVFVNVVVGESSRLGFARPGDTTWTVVKNAGYVQDVIYLNGLVYFVSSGRLNHTRVSEGVIRVCNISCSEPTARHFTDLPDHEWIIHQSYMFELCGELHIAVRVLCTATVSGRPPDHHRFDTLCFEVYKLDLSTREWDWFVTLGDYALFLGSNSSFSVKASDYPACMPNCIYYTDNNDEARGHLNGNDMGVYSLINNELEPLYKGDCSISRFSPPLWITPNLF